MISIIIVTHNRINLVQECIESIIPQAQNKHEIIVIDNCSSDNTSNILKNRYGDRLKIIKTGFKKSLGSCKNIGAREALGEIIAFTDDDCIPSDNWLDRILACFESYGCDIAAGPVRLLKSLRFPWWWRPSLSWTMGIAEINSKNFLPLGSNVAFKKDTLIDIESSLDSGTFKEIVYTEDNFRIMTAVKKGYKIKLDESMIVYHNVDQKRISFNYLIRRSWLEGKHWAKNKKSIKILACRIAAFLFNPLRFIISFDLNYLLRAIVSISYVIECAKAKTRYSLKGCDILNFFNYSFFPHKPVAVCIDITSRCNLRCPFCEIGTGIKNDFSNELTKKELFGIIEQLKKWNINIIDSISGGEPFIKKDFWEFLEYCEYNNIRINTLCTNGTLLDDLDNKKFRLLSASVAALSISLDSNEQKAHDFFRGTAQAYSKLIKGLENICRLKKETGLKLEIHTSTVVTKDNYKNIPDILLFAKKMHVDYASFQPINYMPNFYGVSPVPLKKNFMLTEKEELKKLKETVRKSILTGKKNKLKNNLRILSKWIVPYFEQAMDKNAETKYFFNKIYKKFICFVPFSHLKINSEGYILPCYLLPPVNNIRKTDIKASWLNDIAPVRKHLKNGRFFEQCKTCYCDFPFSLQYNSRWYPFKKSLFFFNIFIYYIKKIVFIIKSYL